MHLSKSLFALGTLVIWSFASFSVQAAHVITRAGRKIEAAEIRSLENGSIVLITPSGQRMEFKPSQYRSAAADRPTELAVVEKLLESGNQEEALKCLRAISIRYRHLKWDQEAFRKMAPLCYALKRYEEAAEAYALVVERTDAEQQQYFEALRRADRLAELQALLDMDIAKGSRASAARAYVMRGEVKARSGDYKGATSDWLKVTTFFTDQTESVAAAEQGFVEYIMSEEGGRVE